MTHTNTHPFRKIVRVVTHTKELGDLRYMERHWEREKGGKRDIRRERRERMREREKRVSEMVIMKEGEGNAGEKLKVHIEKKNHTDKQTNKITIDIVKVWRARIMVRGRKLFRVHCDSVQPFI